MALQQELNRLKRSEEYIDMIQELFHNGEVTKDISLLLGITSETLSATLVLMRKVEELQEEVSRLRREIR
jgi:hypothetical protein